MRKEATGQDGSTFCFLFLDMQWAWEMFGDFRTSVIGKSFT